MPFFLNQKKKPCHYSNIIKLKNEISKSFRINEKTRGSNRGPYIIFVVLSEILNN